MNTETASKPPQPSLSGSIWKNLTKGESINHLGVYIILVVGAITMIAPFAFLISSPLVNEASLYLFS